MEPDSRIETATAQADPRAPAAEARGADVAPDGPATRRAERPPSRASSVTLERLRAFYGEAEQVKGIDLDFHANEVTAIIGPSGCGKSTMVRCINRMHEEIPGAHAEGRVLLDDVDVYGPGVDVVAVRRAIGMVFQKPNPFPTMSIFDNVAAGLRLTAPPRRPAREGRGGAARRRACGTRSPTASPSPAPACPAASSSGCASRARWRSSPR